MTVNQRWNDSEFDAMGWHDCRLYGVKFLDEQFIFSLDIDYILEWVNLGDSFNFLVAPCVIEFHHASDFKMQFNYGNNLLCFIRGISRSNKRLSPNGNMEEWDYEIECDVGFIKFTCCGFEQKIMAPPRLIDSQDLNRDFSVFSLTV